MVFVSLSRLVFMITAIKNCPIDIPKRIERLETLFCTFKPTSDDFVSVYAGNLEDPIEKKLEELDDIKRRKIIEKLINQYTGGNIRVFSGGL